MNYRTATLLPMGDLGGAGTKIIEVNVKDIISRLILNWRITRASEGMSAPSHADITKIELVDGSDVLFSMNGGECQALCIYDRKVPTMNDGEYSGTNYQSSSYGLDFGRKLYDPELALDPSKFRNLQLKVTHNEKLSDTSADVGSLEVLAEVFDEKVVTPIGFLMSKKVWSAALPLAGYAYVELPTDFPIRKLLLKAYGDGETPYGLVDQFRIDEDNEKRIPFDYTDLERYTIMMKGVWQLVVEQIYTHVTGTTKNYYVTPTEWYTGFAPQMIDVGLHVPKISGKGGKITIAVDAGEPWVYGVVHGYLPNHCFEFPFGDQMDLADWYDVTRLGSCRARLEAGGTDVTDSALVLQQLRRY